MDKGSISDKKYTKIVFVFGPCSVPEPDWGDMTLPQISWSTGDGDTFSHPPFPSTHLTCRCRYDHLATLHWLE